MEELLAYIADKMTAAHIPYEFGEWGSRILYPYCVGTFAADAYRYEDGCTAGRLTVDVWSRGSKLSAVQMADRIAHTFEDLQEVRDGRLFYIRYTGCDLIPSGQMGLFRVSVSLDAKMWKGV